MMSCVRNLARTTLWGILGGLLATAAMNSVVVAARALGLFHDPTPLQPATCSDDAEPGEQEPLPLATRAGWLTAHVLYGALCGAVFSLFATYLVRPLGPGVPRLPVGVGFGLLLWGVGTRGYLPELRLSIWPGADTGARLATMATAHGVFGAVLAAVDWLAGRCRR